MAMMKAMINKQGLIRKTVPAADAKQDNSSSVPEDIEPQLNELRSQVSHCLNVLQGRLAHCTW